MKGGTVTCDEEGRMDQMILWAMTMVALCWWAGGSSWRTAVAVQRQAEVGRSRVK